MRVTSATLYSGEDEMLSFGLGLGEGSNRYFVRSIAGIDANDIVPRYYSRGQTTGTPFFDLALKPREIVMLVEINPNFLLGESFGEVRDRMYRAIYANRTGALRLELMSGATTVAQISGFVTKFEASHFTKNPQVQITLRCDDPMFRAINPVTLTGDDFSTNPLIVPDSLSTAPHGFSMILEFEDDVDFLTIDDGPFETDWSFQVAPDGGFLNGDILYFSSDITNKYLYVDRSSTIIPMVDAITPNSVWPMMFPGANQIGIVELAFMSLTQFQYYAAYWGV